MTKSALTTGITGQDDAIGKTSPGQRLLGICNFNGIAISVSMFNLSGYFRCTICRGRVETNN